MTSLFQFDDTTRVLVLTGAGVSAESGIPTFRDAGGLWENEPVERVATLDGFIDDPVRVWRFYGERRTALNAVRPNPGHLALARLEQALGDRFLLVTQNIDGLHQRAGSRRVIELHGNVRQTRCSRCDRPPFDDDECYPATRLPACGRCHARGEFALLRPHVVWFGEHLDGAHLIALDRFVIEAPARLVFLAAGTSGAVDPAASIVAAMAARGAETWLVNEGPAMNEGAFQHVLRGKSGRLLPEVIDGALAR